MTIPTRPAPAPPSAASAAAGANANLQRLRLQLEQQQQQLQHQEHNQQRMIGKSGNNIKIKLPPPPTKSKSMANNSYYQSPPKSNNFDDGAKSSITRKFPVARYAPATNWDDSPFDSFATNENNYEVKKIPPPRPPPPKISNTRKALAPAPPLSPRPPTSVNILTSIFNRKKQAKAAQSSRIYGVSAGVSTTSANYNSWNTTTSTSNNSTAYNNYSNHTMNSVFETCKNNNNNNNNNTNINSHQEPQLISFDSPPSSPTFTQKSNSDCVSVDSFSSDSNFSSPNNGSASQAESGFEDDFGSVFRSRQPTTSPLDPWETLGTMGSAGNSGDSLFVGNTGAPVRNLNAYNIRQSQDNPLCNGKNLLPPVPSLQMPTIIKPKIAQKPKAPKPPSHNQQSRSPTDMTPQYSTANNNYGGGVSLSDVISGKADALYLSKENERNFKAGTADFQGTPYGISLYNFEGVEDGDLSFRENEKIYLLEKVSEEWYRGRTRSGCEGIFPINYIEIKEPLVSNSTDAENTPQQAYQWPTARSLYNFAADVDGDLALKENDLITIYYKVNDDWLYGEVDGRLGQFPSNFLDRVPANLPPMPQT